MRNEYLCRLNGMIRMSSTDMTSFMQRQITIILSENPLVSNVLIKMENTFVIEIEIEPFFNPTHRHTLNVS